MPWYLLFSPLIVVEAEPLLSWGYKKTRGRAVVGDPLAFLTVVMKNYYETIITYSSFVFIFSQLVSGPLSPWQADASKGLRTRNLLSTYDLADRGSTIAEACHNDVYAVERLVALHTLDVVVSLAYRE